MCKLLALSIWGSGALPCGTSYSLAQCGDTRVSDLGFSAGDAELAEQLGAHPAAGLVQLKGARQELDKNRKAGAGAAQSWGGLP